MRQSEWPTKLEGNMFTVAKHDPALTPETVKVVTWSSVFHDGGSVTVEAYLPDKRRVTLASIPVNENRTVMAEIKHLQLLVDKFNENPKRNWRALVNGARKRVTAYYQRSADENAKKLELALAGTFVG